VQLHFCVYILLGETGLCLWISLLRNLL